MGAVGQFNCKHTYYKIIQNNTWRGLVNLLRRNGLTPSGLWIKSIKQWNGCGMRMRDMDSIRDCAQHQVLGYNIYELNSTKWC